MGLNIDRIWQMIGNKKESNKPTHARAVVLRKDNDGTIWVKIEGGVDETPVYSTTANVKPNDIVTVKVSGGKAYIEGSTSAPSVGVTEFGDAVSEVRRRASDASEKAQEAKNDSTLALLAAKEAASVTKATSQHFWVNEDEPETYGGAGAHVTEQTKDEWEEAIRRRFPDLSDEKPYHNILMNSLGILLRTALNNLVSITKSAVTFFDGLGNNASNIVAYFGKDGSRIGGTGASYVDIDGSGLYVRNRRDSYRYIDASFGERENIVSEFGGTVTSVPFTVTLNYTPKSGTIKVYRGVDNSFNPPSGEASYSYTNSGESVTVTDSRLRGYEYGIFYTATDWFGSAMTVGSREIGENGVGDASFAHGDSVVASGENSYAGGRYSKATGLNSHAEGEHSKACGYMSHAEGFNTVASGDSSHAEGSTSTASEMNSHAEGDRTVALGLAAHAEGRETNANGYYSHAQNYGTVADYISQTAMGEYNVNKSEDLLEVGNGSSSTRSNALELTRGGKLTLADDVIGKSGSVTHRLSEKLDASELDPVKEKTDKLEIANNSTVYFTISAGSGSGKLQILYNPSSKNLAVRGFDGSSWTNVQVIATLS